MNCNDNNQDYTPNVSNLNRLSGYVRRCIEDYNMIDAGETIAIGVSGGKDSLTLLCVLAQLRNYYPKKFNLHAVTVDMGFDGLNFDNVEKLCEELNVPFTLKRTGFSSILFSDSKVKNPCSLCAKMRRGALHDMITDLNIKKIALAHHFDDAVETFLMSLLYEGRVNCFQPVTYMDRADVTQIRPMLYVKEDMILRFSAISALPIVNNPCPMNGVSKREETKELLKTLSAAYPDIKSKIFGAMQRMPLPGW